VNTGLDAVLGEIEKFLTDTRPGDAADERETKILDLGRFQILVYEGPQGLRVESWKHPTTAWGGVLVEHEVEGPTAELQRHMLIAKPN
jgi:hypothetical protein